MLNLEKINEFEEWELEYAKRHRIPVHWIKQNERLALAAFLELQIKNQVLSVSNARRVYVSEYPESNRINVPKKVIEADGYWYYDNKYALGSVLEMIQADDDAIREVKPLCV